MIWLCHYQLLNSDRLHRIRWYLFGFLLVDPQNRSWLSVSLFLVVVVEEGRSTLESLRLVKKRKTWVCFPSWQRSHFATWTLFWNRHSMMAVYSSSNQRNAMNDFWLLVVNFSTLSTNLSLTMFCLSYVILTLLCCIGKWLIIRNKQTEKKFYWLKNIPTGR